MSNLLFFNLFLEGFAGRSVVTIYHSAMRKTLFLKHVQHRNIISVSINSHIGTSIQCPIQNIGENTTLSTITCYTMNGAIGFIVKPLSVNRLIRWIVTQYVAECSYNIATRCLYDKGVAGLDIGLDQFTTRIAATPLSCITIRGHEIACPTEYPH